MALFDLLGRSWAMDIIWNLHEGPVPFGNYKTIALFNRLPEEAFAKRGAGTDEINNRTVRAHVYHIAGHELRHINIIRERYLHSSSGEFII